MFQHQADLLLDWAADQGRGYIYHKGALVVNGPRPSPSLIMTKE
jgi:hypothetical protein